MTHPAFTFRMDYDTQGALKSSSTNVYIHQLYYHLTEMCFLSLTQLGSSGDNPHPS